MELGRHVVDSGLMKIRQSVRVLSVSLVKFSVRSLIWESIDDSFDNLDHLK